MGGAAANSFSFSFCHRKILSNAASSFRILVYVRSRRFSWDLHLAQNF